MLGMFRQLIEQLEKPAQPVGRNPKAVVDDVRAGANKSALKSASSLPVIMCVTYIALMLFYKSRGGYKPVDVMHNAKSAGH